MTAVPAVVVLMGVSGSGKSTVGRLLAGRLGVPFVEADDLHPAGNRSKMAAGRPLDEKDRAPWLLSLVGWIRQATESGTGGVLACSALRYEYRERFRRAGRGVWMLHLAIGEAAARRRVAERRGHFMPAALVESQYTALEPLRPDEPGLTVDAELPAPAIVDLVFAALRAGG
ncbi:gluconokinase [Streptomyces sp. NPDC049040]|uniref:gluconokinase n=1 Tax=Streptomyces sp. NPDC049040 TaxID=3365593 RepID=UPI0037130CC2